MGGVGRFDFDMERMKIASKLIRHTYKMESIIKRWKAHHQDGKQSRVHLSFGHTSSSPSQLKTQGNQSECRMLVGRHPSNDFLPGRR